ncbi:MULTISPECIES: MucR family transcriptional regulator [unclassified Methylobacterium]|jgi:predicted transcriptional regulator|uniref:MucR family transcriptional regulator n=1 Tax=unclassified Methylobacterium TaxID=2615210 RepID=UPI0013526595|nr:MucR family transcriptional regulator [Methylobacterium sp. 2A]MWV20564.1 MucR family transcriptional regulator [Methylobacterium sp. 2A]
MRTPQLYVFSREIIVIRHDVDRFSADFRRAIDGFAVRIVAAYLARNAVPPTGLPEILTGVHKALIGLAPPADTGPAPEQPNAAEIRKSVQHDGLISFVDGRSYKTLKRHLKAHGLTPDQYRARYGLPHDYPMAAPGYVARRAEIARAIRAGHNPD